MLLPINHTLQVTSFGGTATTTLINWLFENKQDISGDQYWKHQISPPDNNLYSIPHNYKPLYLIGDPVSSILSIFRRRIIRAHAINMECSYDMSNFTLDRYIQGKRDYFNIHKQLINWTTAKRPYPILCIKYKAIWNNIDTICNFWNLDDTIKKTFPVKVQRNSQNKFLRYKQPLAELYKESIDHIDSLQDCFIIQ